MNNEKFEERLIQLLEDVAYIRASLANIERQNLGARIDSLEVQNSNHEKSIRSLENRNSTMEQFVRNNMTDNKKQMISVYISLGMAVFSAILSFVFNML